MAPALTKSGAPSNRREKIPEGTLCVVCDDSASGIHYSVASCNGCKTFFRRALVNKQTFTCQFNGECLVGKNVRCVCRSCRLKKCFEQGMDPKAIQHDRDKIRYTKVLKREKEAAAKARDSALSHSAREEAERESMMKVKEEIGSPGGPECCDIPSTSKEGQRFLSPMELILSRFISTDDCDLDSTLSELMKIERKLVEVRNTYRFDDQISTIWNMYIGSRALLSEDDWLSSATQQKPMLFSLSERVIPTQTSPYRCARVTPWSLREWFQRDLTLMMEWVKLIPGSDNLTTPDKVILQKNFALQYAVYQLTYYTRDTTVLCSSDFAPAEESLEERLRTLKRRGKDLRNSPPPPAPCFSTSINAELMNLANSLYKQPLAKRIKDEILEDEPTCSAYLRKLTEQASLLSAASPATSSFVNSPIDNTFLINNGLKPVSSYAEETNPQNNLPPLPPTMSTGLPGALSNCLASSLQAATTNKTTLPTTLPPFPTGFFSALANSPASLGFPPSPLLTSLTASPLITSSPLMGQSLGQSPLMASLTIPSLPTMPSLSSLPSFTLTTSFPTFLPPALPIPPSFQVPPAPSVPTVLPVPPVLPAPIPMEKEKTPEIDVETISMDGRSEGRGARAIDNRSTESREDVIQFRVPASVSRSCSLTGSADMISTLNLMSMRSPDEPCSSKMMDSLLEKMSVSPGDVLSVPSTVANMVQASQIKDEPFSPAAATSISSTVIRSIGDVSEKSKERTKLSKRLEETAIIERPEEDEETPCDPTPEAQIANRINYPDGTFIEREKDRPFNDELYGLLIEGIWKIFRRENVDQESFVLFKMMSFFNMELTYKLDHKLSDDGVRFVEKMRSKMYTQLMLHLQRTRGKEGLRTFSNLLLLGSTVSRVRNALRKMFTMTSVFVPTNDLVDQLILRDNDERVPSPSAFKHYHPPY